METVRLASVFYSPLALASVFFAVRYLPPCKAENNSLSSLLPTVNVLRISSMTEQDCGFLAAAAVFHNLPRWNDRFRLKIVTHAVRREVGQSVSKVLRQTLRALVKANESYVALLGPDYTAEVQPVTQITPIYNLISICGSVSDIFGDTTAFPLLYRFVPVSYDAEQLLLKTMSLLNIRRTFALTLREQSFMLTVSSLVASFIRRPNSTVPRYVVFDAETDLQDDIKQLIGSDDDVDYVMGILSNNLGFAMCETYRAAAHLTLRPTFVNIERMDPRDGWQNAMRDTKNFNCTLDELRAAMNGSIFVVMRNMNYVNDVKSLQRLRHDNMTLERIKQHIQRGAVAVSGSRAKPIAFSYFAYDGAIALFTAMYRTDIYMERTYGVRLHELSQKRSSPEFWAQFSSKLRYEMNATDFVGATSLELAGRVKFDAKQSRTGGLSIIQYQGVADDSKTDNFVSLGELNSYGEVHIDVKLLRFRTPTGEPPHVWRQKYLSPEKQTFSNSRLSQVWLIVIVLVSVVTVAALVGVAVMYWRQQMKTILLRQQQNLSWLISNSSLTPASPSRGLTLSASIDFKSESSTLTNIDTHQQLATYVDSNTLVFLRNATIQTAIPPSTTAPISQNKAIELNQTFAPASILHGLAHDNINKFVGICLDFGLDDHHALKPVVAFEYQPKSDLRDMLNNTDWSIDSDLKYCFMADCVRGMQALHTANCVHGFLHTANVLMDAKFTCKITDYGLANFARTREDLEPIRITELNELTNETLEKLCFRAPEQIRNGFHGSDDVFKRDIYSVGVLLVEIVTRELPKFRDTTSRQSENLSYTELVRLCLSQSKNFEPIVPLSTTTHQQLCSLIFECTSFDPIKRPLSMSNILKRLLNSTPGFATTSIVESLVLRLQRYANDLESIVEERTRALLEESRRTEQLLLEILPPSVADELKRGNRVDPQSFEQVSIYFSDVVDFDLLSARLWPMQMIKLLNWLYTTFDGVLEQFNVYKVETVGDAYMVASGVPKPSKFQHADEICRFSLAMMKTVNKFNSSAVALQEGNSVDGVKNIRLRIGLHCGACVAGVIGVKLPRYCLFGDTINTASRMQSTGQADKIHVSDTFRKFVEQYFVAKFQWSVRGQTSVKGLGTITTHWLEQ